MGSVIWYSLIGLVLCVGMFLINQVIEWLIETFADDDNDDRK